MRPGFANVRTYPYLVRRLGSGIELNEIAMDLNVLLTNVFGSSGLFCWGCDKLAVLLALASLRSDSGWIHP
jgi:hypothetical protein